MVIRSHYFEPREIDLGDDDLVVLSCIRNEVARLPYFLEYYRKMGVNRFLCVDNGSTDGTGEYLRAQPDVEVFPTTASYRGSAAGRLWLQELADTYATGHWTLTVDVDELLVYPGSGRVPLRRLCRYLDRNGYEGLFTVMLDMYSDKPFAETNYVPGTPFLDTCSYFETESYTLAPSPTPPFMSIFGGPRGRLYAASGDPTQGPVMKKVPLVKWLPGFSYIRSTHTHRYIPLADLTGALLHFKFFASFEAGLRTEYHRGDRRQNQVYARYLDQIGPETSFYGEHSHKYDGPRDLVARGVMTAGKRWRNFCRRFAETRQRPFNVDRVLPAPPERPVGLEALAMVWPFANNPGLARHFGLQMPGRGDDRAALVAEMSEHIRLITIEESRVLLSIGEPALHRWQRTGLSVALSVAGTVLGVVAVDGSEDTLEIVTDSLEPNVCEWPLEVGAALHGAATSQVTVHLVDREDQDRPLPEVGAAWKPGRLDTILFDGRWHHDPRDGVGEGIVGRIERLGDGSVTGWLNPDGNQPVDAAVNVYVNGRLAVHVVATAPAEGTAGDEAAEPNRVTFTSPLPIGHFADLGASEMVVEVRTACTNIALDRSPLRFPTTVRSAEWVEGQGWRPRP